MTKKPNLAAAMKKAVKPEVVETQSRKEPVKAVEPSKGDVPPSRQGKKAITGFFDPAVSRQFKLLGAEQDKTLQAMLTEAFNDYFEKYGKNPIA